MSDIELIKEHDKFYEVIIDDKPKKLFKFNIDEIKRDAKLRLNKVAKVVTTKDIRPLLDQLEFCSSVSPRVNEYEKIATEITKKINKLYNIVAFAPSIKSGNIFHGYYKQLNPDIYGKAQTFTKYTDLLFEDLKYIKEKIDGRIDTTRIGN